MYRSLLANAARNSIAAKDAAIYKRAFDNIAFLLGSPGAVKRLQLPSPEALASLMKQTDAELLSGFDLDEVLTGLFLKEYFQDNPERLSTFTPEYFSEVALRFSGVFLRR